jgi:ADP-ribose pyrophosphatase
MNIQRPISDQPIPDNAEVVFKGKVFDVYQWKQEQFDGSFATYEKTKRPDTVVTFLVLDDGKILLTEQEQPGKIPFIAACGGRVDEGEDILEAAKRELLEESGYEADDWMLWKSVQPQSKIEWAVYVFIAKVAKKVSDQSLDSGERIKFKPVTFDEFIQMARNKEFREQEILTDLYESLLDSEKYNDLKKLFEPLQ